MSCHSPFGRECTDKDATGIVHKLDAVARLFEVQDQVFGSVLVGESEGLFDVVDLDDQTLLDGLPDDIDSGQRVGLTVDLLLDLFEKFRLQVDCDKDDLGVDPVLGL